MTALPSTTTPDQASRLRSLVDAGPLPAPGRRARVVAVSSGKGGVGKTNLAVNLAIALQRRGVRTTLVDLDLGLANADLLCGLNPPSRLDRASLRDTTLEALTLLAPGGFRLVPGSVGLGRPGVRPAVGLGIVSEADAAPLARLHELDACSDVVILDTGAGMGQLVRSCLAAAELALLVATPEPTSIADAYALLTVACGGRTGGGAANGPDAQFVPMLLLNQCASATEAQEVHARMAGVSRRFLGRDLPLLAAVPADPAVPRAVRDRRPVLLASPDAPASNAVTAAAERVISTLGLEERAARSAPGVFTRQRTRLAWLWR